MSESKPQEKCVLVTGASSGIGLAITQRLLHDGYSVLGIARDFSRSKIDHARFTSYPIDLSKIEDLQKPLDAIRDRHEENLRALIHCAGVGVMGYLEQLSVEQIRYAMNVNFLSHVVVTKTFLPELKKRGRGDVIFVASEAALQGAQQGSIYCASKFALRGFAQALREECSRSGVRVTVINPGAVDTPFFDKLQFRPGAELSNSIAPRDIADVMMMVLQARRETVLDEINLSPLKRVWQKQERQE
jgi:3-hydroxy acid dehydrogenase / malonic semialdehyde reductase